MTVAISTPHSSPDQLLANSEDCLELCSAREALKTEIAGLESLKMSLDGEGGAAFVRAVDLLLNTSGRLIVSGIGKSGHIARKIASTLSSTGIVSLFLHPSEASHGDLGMICAGDTLMVLSNSGETDELLNLLVFANQNSIPLVAMTQGPKSALASAATVTLLIPRAEEACPMGLAPTTSTTMMLALGDALAVALLKKRPFTPADFKSLHPGGSLGRKLLRVSDLMHTQSEIPLVSELMLMSDVLMVMTQKAFGCVGVCNDQGRLLGVITDGDLRRHMGDGFLGMYAKDVMTGSPKVIHKDVMALEALELMNERKITTFFVVDDAEQAEAKEGSQPEVQTEIQPIGMLHIHDLLRAKII